MEPKKQDILFGTESMTGTSRVVHITDQVTFKGVGLQEGDEVLFYLVSMTPGEMDKWCKCQHIPGAKPEIESLSPLMCEGCDDEGNRVQVKMTRDNPIVILDAPQDSMVMLAYEGEGFNTAKVIAIYGTTTKDLTPAMRGCPAVCTTSEANWHRTGNARANLEEGKRECEETDGLGNYRWVECGDLVWRQTGLTRKTADDTLECEETDDLGDYRWVECGDVEWWQTGVRRANADVTKIECQETDKLGEIRWVECGDIEWYPTGLRQSDVEADKIKCQETDGFGHYRWVECGDLVWVPVGQCRISADNPERVECLETDSFGDYRWTDTEDVVWVDTGDFRINEKGEVEKRQRNQLDDYRWVPDYSEFVWTFTGNQYCDFAEGTFKYKLFKEYVNQFGQKEWQSDGIDLDWSQTGVTECSDGYVLVQMTTPCGDIRWKRTLEECSEEEEPKVVSTIQACNRNFAVWSDGNITLLDVDCGEEYHITYTANGVDAIPPTDETTYYLGDEATVKKWTSTEPAGYHFLEWMDAPSRGHVYRPDDTIVMDSSKVLYAQWGVEFKYKDGLDNAPSQLNELRFEYEIEDANGATAKSSLTLTPNTLLLKYNGDVDYDGTQEYDGIRNDVRM